MTATCSDALVFFEYEPGTWGPSEAVGLAADSGGWHCPACAEPSKP